MTEPRNPSGDTDDSAAVQAFFDAARREAPVPGEDFMARLTAGALAEMPVARTGALASGVPGLMGQVKAALGGWVGLSGLATACAVGIWIGANPPAALDLDGLWPDSAALGEIGVDPLSGFELALLEG